MTKLRIMEKQGFRVIATICILTIVTGCGKSNYPEGYDATSVTSLPNSIEPLPIAPDYTNKDAWAMLPEGIMGGVGKKQLPKGLKDERDALDVDVFYIHPTLYDYGEPWLASLDDKHLNDMVDRWTTRHQGGIFVGVGRVFAPRYRQAHYRCFSIGDGRSEKALRVAYKDVREAFMHWMDNWDMGRPIILAGHSQGSWHARWLIQEFFDGTEMQDRLVTAYVPGMAMYDEDYRSIEFCQNENDTGCICTWMTFATGHTPEWLNEKYKEGDVPACINPLNWETDDTKSRPEEHLGAVTEKFRLLYRNVLTARVHRGKLWLDEPQAIGGKKLHRDNWHVGDLNLFWSNIRENARVRTENFSDH
jgi:hypothetical protein